MISNICALSTKDFVLGIYVIDTTFKKDLLIVVINTVSRTRKKLSVFNLQSTPTVRKSLSIQTGATMKFVKWMIIGQSIIIVEKNTVIPILQLFNVLSLML